MPKKVSCFSTSEPPKPFACRGGSTWFVFLLCYIEYAPLTNIPYQTHGGDSILLMEKSPPCAFFRANLLEKPAVCRMSSGLLRQPMPHLSPILSFNSTLRNLHIPYLRQKGKAPCLSNTQKSPVHPQMGYTGRLKRISEKLISAQS